MSVDWFETQIPASPIGLFFRVADGTTAKANMDVAASAIRANAGGAGCAFAVLSR